MAGKTGMALLRIKIHNLTILNINQFVHFKMNKKKKKKECELTESYKGKKKIVLY